ncbi:hypothetical protein AAFF_G00045940 [Aldrovandia affinis]|uniref:Uncharacterized protein n=1 Tax=Aldrovandia affinis TaxID=143900 RepID=A0AAD7S1Y4_9TELE|nr:hypothetical protein AAFF_G00045940 [Aldrovandia affinis]
MGADNGPALHLLLPDHLHPWVAGQQPCTPGALSIHQKEDQSNHLYDQPGNGRPAPCAVTAPAHLLLLKPHLALRQGSVPALLLPQVSEHVRRHRLPGVHQHPALRLPHAPLLRQAVEAALRRAHQHRRVAGGGALLLALHPDEVQQLLPQRRLLQGPAHAQAEPAPGRAHDGLRRAPGLRPPARRRRLLHLPHRPLAAPRRPRPAAERRQAQGPAHGAGVRRRLPLLLRALPRQLPALPDGLAGHHHALPPAAGRQALPPRLPVHGQPQLLPQPPHLLLPDHRVPRAAVPPRELGAKGPPHERGELVLLQGVTGQRGARRPCGTHPRGLTSAGQRWGCRLRAIRTVVLYAG